MASGRVPARSAPRAGWSAAIIISLPCSPSSDDARHAASAAASAIALRAVHPGGDQLLQLLLTHRTASCSFASTSSAGGHGVGAGQPPGDDGAGRVAEPHRPLQVPPGEQAVAQRAAEGVTRAEAVHHVDRHRRHLAISLPSDASTPFGPCLTTASSTPAACSAAAAACGSRTPTAVSHSSRLPTATVTCGSACGDHRARLLAGGPEHRRGSPGRSTVIPRLPRARSAARVAARLGSWQSPVTVTQNTSAARIASRSSSSAADLQVGRGRVAVEVEREVVGREDLAERDRRRQLRHRRRRTGRPRRSRAARRAGTRRTGRRRCG